MMTRRSLTLSAFSLLLSCSAPLLLAPVFAQAQQAPRSAIQLHLDGEKKVVSQDAQGHALVVWQPLTQASTKVQPGDVVRYTLRAENHGTRPVSGFALTQPIPQGTVYVLHSASADKDADARMSFRTDDPQVFSAQPTVKVVRADGTVRRDPAPASAYTGIRWTFGKAFSPAAPLQVTYLVKVR